ncbi:hypothetical protein [Mangrovicoccus sp. HB161399]|uniref:hypothetical protein n=1 Tax=Mangrovicoccus sp. HB161399 TaxID=2720392 RepID=UPI0015534461|nr:hypothetical protein [Mangrovicoccus sp. HB161399]
MTSRLAPLAVSERTAAAMLDMPPTKFRTLVSQGALPQAKRIGDELRWSVGELEAIVSGNAALPEQSRFEA